MSGTAPGKRLYIKTYGCQMNVYDSERMADVLAPLGYGVTDSPEGADLVVLNTCHIREKATEKVYSEIGRLRAHKERRAAEGKGTTIAIAGCVAQAEGEEIIARAPIVDLVVGPQAYHKLPELIARAARKTGERLAAYWRARDRFIAVGTQTMSAGDPHSFVANVAPRLIEVVKISPDFDAAYTPVIVMARQLGRSNPAAAMPFIWRRIHACRSRT